MSLWRHIWTLVGTAVALGVGSAAAQPAVQPQPTSQPQTAPAQLPKLLADVSALRSRFQQLQAEERKLKEGNSSKQRDTKFRLMRYGITAGVSATVYTPGFAGNTLDGIAGGAMPFVGFFPGYWGRNAPKNLYCALEWSASEASAVSSAENEQVKEAGSQAGEAANQTSNPEAAGADAAAKVAQVDANGTAAASAKAEEAAVLQAAAGAVGGASATPTAATKTAADAEKNLKDSIDTAQAALDAYEQALERAKVLRNDAIDEEFAEDRLAGMEEEESQLEAMLRRDLKDGIYEDKVDALASAAQQTLRRSVPLPPSCADQVASNSIVIGWRPLAPLVPAAPVPATPRDIAERACALAQEKAKPSPIATVVQALEIELNAQLDTIDTGKTATRRTLAESFANAALTSSSQSAWDDAAIASCAASLRTSATYKAVLPAGNSPNVTTPPAASTTTDAAETACRLAQLRLQLVEARRSVGDFRGKSTNCTLRKFGFYMGYPGMFSATTMVESRTPRNRVERDITPIVSLGFVTAPNALAAFTLGPWFGNAEINEDEHAFVWGFAGGLALTGDIFTALAD